jgi:hypothetical protein
VSFYPDAALFRQVNTQSMRQPERLESEETSGAIPVNLLFPTDYAETDPR